MMQNCSVEKVAESNCVRSTGIRFRGFYSQPIREMVVGRLSLDDFRYLVIRNGGTGFGTRPARLLCASEPAS